VFDRLLLNFTQSRVNTKTHINLTKSSATA